MNFSPVGSLGVQTAWLFLLALPIASITWTVTHEEIFREPREFCQQRSKSCRALVQRKFFYVFTCEYCFSHYVTALFVAVTGFHLLFDDWRGFVIGGFALVWMVNFYMSVFGHVRLEIKEQRIDIEKEEKELRETKVRETVSARN